MIKLFREVTTDQLHPDRASEGTTLDWSNDVIAPHQQREETNGIQVRLQEVENCRVSHSVLELNKVCDGFWCLGWHAKWMDL
jgi:hypothetical protein